MCYVYYVLCGGLFTIVMSNIDREGRQDACMPRIRPSKTAEFKKQLSNAYPAGYSVFRSQAGIINCATDPQVDQE